MAHTSLQFKKNAGGQWRWGMYPRVLLMGLSKDGHASKRHDGSLVYLLRLATQSIQGRPFAKAPSRKWIERSDQPATVPGMAAAERSGRGQGERHRWSLSRKVA